MLAYTYVNKYVVIYTYYTYVISVIYISVISAIIYTYYTYVNKYVREQTFLKRAFL